MSPSRLEYLFNRYISQSASAEEEKEFMELVEQDSNKDEIQALLKELIIETEPTKKPSFESEEGILQAILMARPAGKLVALKKNNWKRYIAAASIILSLGIGSYFAFFHDKEEPIVAENGKPIKDDVLPGGDRAVLTLADGSQIVLDSAAMGSLAMQGGAEVAKIAEGELVYEASGAVGMVYNTVSTPRGGQYQLTLSDGTKVWLNAASSIRFPTAFQSEERVVEITGEVYFEVSPQPLKGSKIPFRVKSGSVETEVLGTHFNVNSYKDEGEIRVTLLEGAVNVRRESSIVKLVPGQSAFVTNFAKVTSAKKTTADEAIQVKNNVDTEAVMAWKNGYFSFKDADIRTVMRQLSRWYDIEVVFSGAVPKQQFNGEIGRKLTLKEVLEGLAFTSQHFKIEEGRKLIIK